MRDLFAYLKTLPPVSGRARRHDLAFPFDVRRLVGLWKVLYLHGGPFRRDPSQSAQWNRGAYLVNGPGHCAECHSPRNFLGAVVASERFAGGPSPDGKGWVPNITPAGLQHWSKEDIAWSAKDIASFLDDGMNPAGDFAGGAMVETIRNTSKLDAANRAAIAAYIVSLPPRQGQSRRRRNDISVSIGRTAAAPQLIARRGNRRESSTSVLGEPAKFATSPMTSAARTGDPD